MSLKSYVDASYPQDRRQLEDVYRIINEVIPIFAYAATKGTLGFGNTHGTDSNDDLVEKTEHASELATNKKVSKAEAGKKKHSERAVRDEQLTWPYRIRAGADLATMTVEQFSPSTHGMILHMLEIFQPQRPSSALISQRLKPVQLKLAAEHKQAKGRLIEIANTCRVQLINSIAAVAENSSLLTVSRSYGDDDPMTLTWYVELAARSRALTGDIRESEALNTCKLRILEAAKRALNRLSANTTQDVHFLNLNGLKEPQPYEISHPFWRLRVGHLMSAVEGLLKSASPDGQPTAELEQMESILNVDFRSQFRTNLRPDLVEQILHQHLAYFADKDPRFDPAQLVFSFEGLLRHDRRALPPATVDHVFKVLSDYQEREPCWRPTQPILGTERGLSLFPLSVEIANSVLRSCEVLNQDEIAPRHFSHFEPQMRRYVSWLIGQVERFSVSTQDGRKDVAGWHSDYVPERGTIHLWQTSQILLFLAHYASLLQRKIAVDGIAEANISIKPAAMIKRIQDYWKQEPLNKPKEYAVLTQIYNDYIHSRKVTCQRDPNCSFLLYGPPGTGKTTVAEQMAVELEWPLITITVSDFLADGAAAMEARAKMIFLVLCEQDDVVILFDEIDQFLLDRNSYWYERQEDVFKFMTPGMLTKLQELRDAAQSIFIAATNYYERIDGAIKRRGRFDARFLLSLPDKERRLAYINAFKADRETEKRNQASVKATVATATAQAAIKPEDEIAKATALYGWSDLKKLVSQMDIDLDQDDASFAGELIKAGRECRPSVEIRNYQRRFVGPGTEGVERPLEEFCSLIYLCAEVGVELQPRDMGFLQLIVRLLEYDEVKSQSMADLVKRYIKENIRAKNSLSLNQKKKSRGKSK
jgi:hypothetical protein